MDELLYSCLSANLIFLLNIGAARLEKRGSEMRSCSAPYPTNNTGLGKADLCVTGRVEIRAGLHFGFYVR